MSDTPTTSQMLAVFIFSFGLGGTVLISLLVKDFRTKMALLALLVISSASLFKPDGVTKPMVDAVGGSVGLWAGFAAIYLAGAGAAHLIFARMPARRDKLRQWLSPALWNVEAMAPTSFGDLLKRWFVTVAAATGNVVGVLITEPDALKALGDALALDRLFFTALLTVMSIVLLAPAEEFFLGAGSRPRGGTEHAEAPSHLEQLLQNMSWRDAGRIGLVFLAWFAVNVLHKCMDESVNNADVKTSSEILLAVVPAAVITYYWCAGLQRGVRQVSVYAARAAAIAALLLFFPGGLTIVAISLPADVFTIFAPAVAKFGFLLATILAVLKTLYDIVLGLLYPIFLSGFGYGLPAIWGGLAVDPSPANARRGPLLTIGFMMGGVALAQIFTFLAVVLVMRVFGLELTDGAVISALLVIVGTVFWGLGLLFTGFPKILQHARTSAHEHSS